MTGDSPAIDDDLLDTVRPPVPLSSIPLTTDAGRQAFLRAYSDYGDTQLLMAVAHVWNSLADPKAVRCTAMGIAAGTGGTGKRALVKVLQACLAEMVTMHNPLPAVDDFAALDDWNQAAKACFAAEEAKEAEIIAYYSAILDGASPPAVSTNADIIQGPWHTIVT